MSKKQGPAPARPRSYHGLWSDFQQLFSEFAGISVQAFDEIGNPVQPSPPLPALCEYLQRYPATASACRKDCFRKATTCRDSRRSLAARCYAGLSYRIVPIRASRRPHSVILVGRVLSEVFGGEQCMGLIEKYRLSRSSFLESLVGVRSIGGADLDRIAAVVRRLAFSLAVTEARFRQRHTLLDRQRDLLSFARRATAHAEQGPARARGMLESLGTMFAASGVALLLADREGRSAGVHASIGLGEDVLHRLSTTDWQGLLESRGSSHLVLAEGRELLGAGLEQVGAPLAVKRLEHGPPTVGYLVMTGAALSHKQLEHLGAAAGFVAAQCVHQAYRERAERKDEEARLLGEMAEKCLTARSVDELLPLALEATMHSLHARRGSILLADSEQGRIIARALRGDHAPISGSIEVLDPGSVSHKVFFDKRPLLVQDTARQPGLRRERQYPYASRSFVSVPLREADHALGVLHLTEREGEGVFTPGDLRLLERLSLQASGAISKIRLEEEVRSLRIASAMDHLTGVHNRRFLEEQLAIEFQRASRFGQPLAVAMLDLDHFKQLNDAMGHAYGDKVLRAIADLIRQQLRSVDIIARYGGDEFVLVLPGTGAAGAINTAEKIRAHVSGAGEQVGLLSDLEQACSLSVGVCVYPEMANSADDLLRRADQALLRAKNSGRNAAQLWSG